jgi:hypothetical protein
MRSRRFKLKDLNKLDLYAAAVPSQRRLFCTLRPMVRTIISGAVCLLLILGSVSEMQGQSRWKAFWKLSGPERCWVIGHLWVSGKAQRISTRAVALADSMSRTASLDGLPEGGTSDAFRHGIWMALLGQEIGTRKAEKLGQAHEKGNYRNWKRGRLEDGAFVDSTSRAMDLWNNDRGLAIAERLPGAGEAALITAILRDMEAGLFRVVSRDRRGRNLDAQRNIIPPRELNGKWETRRCLVPSLLAFPEGSGKQERN